jgi:hypothetical protein
MQNDWQLDDKWLLSVFPLLAKVTGSAMGAEVDIEFLKAVQNEPRMALQMIMDAYLKLVKDAKAKRKKGEPWPVIIIDEANTLMDWEEENKQSLNALLKFFVYLSKQEQLAHVILATSDTFLTQWLESGAPGLEAALRLFQVFTAELALAGPIKRSFCSSFMVGNLTREEARTYFFDYVLPFRELPPGANEKWERVYDVCGGNPGDLRNCALEVAKFRSWELGALCVHTCAALPRFCR